jgi:hypothetical protein
MPVGLLSNSDVWSDRHKAVALYFDEMALAVPDAWSEQRINYPASAVRELKDHELLSIIKYLPEDHFEAARPIIAAIEQWPDEIRAAIEIVKWFPRNGERGTLVEHWYGQHLAEVLAEEKLGYTKWKVGDDAPILRASSRIVQIYLSRLAEIVATRTHFSLTGVDHAPYPGSVFWSPEAVKDVLISGDFDGATKFHGSTAEVGLALFSIRTALPSDVGEVSIAQVVEFRKRNRAALSVFQEFISKTANSTELSRALLDPITAQAAGILIRSEYHRSVEPELLSLNAGLRRLGIQTVWRTLSLRVAAPVIVAQGINSVIPNDHIAHIVTSGVGCALALGRMAYDARTQTTNRRLASPVSYMLSLSEENWTPSFKKLQVSGLSVVNSRY